MANEWHDASYPVEGKTGLVHEADLSTARLLVYDNPTQGH